MSSDDSIPWLGRVLPGLVLMAGGLLVLQGIRTGDEVDVVQTVLRALAGLGLFMGGAVLVARPLAQLIVTPFVRMLFPEDHDYTPPPLYSLARFYWKQGRIEEAVEQYRKILKHHPQEANAYRELTQLLFALGREKEAEAVFRRGMGVLKDEAAREGLQAFYGDLVAGGDGAGSREEEGGGS